MLSLLKHPAIVRLAFTLLIVLALVAVPIASSAATPSATSASTSSPQATPNSAQLASILSSLQGLIHELSILLGSPAQAQTSGLVGYWTFDEGSGTTANDSSGNNNTGTLINGSTWTTGKIGGALSFDGTNDYVLINSTAIGAGDISACAWIYLKSLPPNRFNTILNNSKFYFAVDTFGGNNALAFSNDSTATVGSGTFSMDVWTFACVT